MDIMPTLLEVIGKPVPPNLELDGVSLLGHLKSKSCRLKNEKSCERLHKFMFHHCGTDIFALRSGILITLSLSKVMDLLMETVRNVGGGKSDEYFAGFEEEEGSVKDE